MATYGDIANWVGYTPRMEDMPWLWEDPESTQRFAQGFSTIANMPPAWAPVPESGTVVPTAV